MQDFFRFENLYRSLDKHYIRESASIDAGSILVLKGASGSGKSTLLKILARLLKADSGEVFFRGQNWQSISPQEWRARIQYLSQKPLMFPLTVKENFSLAFGIKIIQERIDFDLEQLNKYMMELGLPDTMLGQDARQLSGGEAARVALIRALLLNPEVLLLDEPTAFLDDKNGEKVIRLLDRWIKEDNNNRILIIVSHKDGELKGMDHVSYLHMTGHGKENSIGS